MSLKTVRQVIVEGAADVEEIERRCGAGGDCGSCRDELCDLIDEVRRTACQHRGVPMNAPSATLELVSI